MTEKDNAAAPPSDAVMREYMSAPSVVGLRQAWTWRPLASLTPASVADVLRRASVGDAHDYLLAAADIEEKDLHYRSVLQTRKLAVAGLPVVITPADNSRAAKRSAELAQQAIDIAERDGLRLHLLDALSKGYAVAEIVWNTSGHGGVWMPERIYATEQHWYRYDQATGRTLRLIDGSAEGQPLAPYKFVHHVPAVISGIPLMGGLARSALWAWVFKSYALRDWASFCELYGQPLRLGRYGPSDKPDDISTLRRAVTELGSDAAAVLPDSMRIDVIESGAKSASADLYGRLISYLDNQVSKAVLGQTGTTDMGGSYAQSKVHDEVRTDLMQADARALASTLLRDLVTPVIRLNLGADAPLPRVHIPVEEPEDMAALADQLVKLGQAGVRHIPEQWVLDKWGIPAATEGQATLGTTTTSTASTTPKIDAKTVAQAQESRTQFVQSAEPDDPTAPLSTTLMSSGTPTFEGWVRQLEALVGQASSLADAQRLIVEAYGNLDSEQLVRVMAAGMALAELQGMADVINEASNG